jgi:hypothetical protein
MTKAAQSVYYFGFYLLLLGLILVISPNTLLTLFQFESTSEVWIRIVGVLVLDLGLYYVIVGPKASDLFLKVASYNRFMAAGFFVLFVMLGLAKPQLILFGAVDLLGGIWTLMALRKG